MCALVAGCQALPSSGLAGRPDAPATDGSAASPAVSAGVARAPLELPDRALTPGATGSAVTSATTADTICRTGYTRTVRPPESYTYALKRRQLDSGYTWHGVTASRAYEEDHLIPLELGGAPTDPRNLWPEFNDHPSRDAANTKDLLENRLHDLVCSGRLALAVAQQAIAGDWWAAYEHYGGQPAPRIYVGRYRAA